MRYDLISDWLDVGIVNLHKVAYEFTNHSYLSLSHDTTDDHFVEQTRLCERKKKKRMIMFFVYSLKFYFSLISHKTHGSVQIKKKLH